MCNNFNWPSNAKSPSWGIDSIILTVILMLILNFSKARMTMRMRMIPPISAGLKINHSKLPANLAN